MGELGLLRRLQPFCNQGVIGDDAAVLPPLAPGQSLAVTTDVLVDGVHFSDQTTPADAVGWRAVAANLSDLAAMGAMPIGITVGLSLPSTVSVDWIAAVYQGMHACLSRYGGTILGGDVCRADQVSLAITALGRVAPHKTIRRDRAQPGQVLLATGYHGASRAGLELLLHPDSPGSLGSLSARDRAALIQAHQQPRPRLDVIQHLQAMSAFEAESIAGMDSSDGLANAVLHLCQASGVGARVLAPQLPLSPPLLPWVGKQTAVDWCLYGGEDFELVLSLASATAHRLLSKLGPEAAIIGTIEAEPAVLLLETPENDSGQALTWESCFQHF